MLIKQNQFLADITGHYFFEPFSRKEFSNVPGAAIGHLVMLLLLLGWR